MTLPVPGRLTPSDKERIIQDLTSASEVDTKLLNSHALRDGARARLKQREAIIAKLSIGIQRKGDTQ